jgi:GT2 family glycosyltransferase
MTRPPVDVVVPFRGTPAELEALRARLARLELGRGDSVLVVDNTPRRDTPAAEGAVPVVHAGGVATPGFARNRGAARGSAEWLVFVDADVEPSPDLLERYFDPPPAERTALLAGGIVDEAVPADGPATARFAYLRATMGQEDMLRDWGFPKTANAACRRAAFESVGGFREDIRAAEDADLTYRLRAAGWEVERREAATGIHLSRRTLRGFVVQKLLWGAGAAWLARMYPGTFPARGRAGLVWWGARTAAKGLLSAARSRDRDEAIIALLDPLEHLAYEFGRSLPNERPWNPLARLP